MSVLGGGVRLRHVPLHVGHISGRYPTLLHFLSHTPMSRGVIFFNLHPFPDESAYVCQIGSRSVRLFGNFPTFLNL